MQIDDMDADLRNSLWNVFDVVCWKELKNDFEHDVLGNVTKIPLLLEWFWSDYFKRPIDEVSNQKWWAIRKTLRDYFFACKWYEVYDFIEFASNHYYRGELLQRELNSVLKREVSGYRFVDGKITQITSPEEITEVEQALDNPRQTVVTHLRAALDLFADRNVPDYRNSIKESISAVEALCKVVAGDPNATLGRALDEIEKGGKVSLHASLKQALDKLYAYTSDAQGIRHALRNQSAPNSEDAKFMLVSCSAFVNYLTVKAERAGIKLQ